MLIFKKPPLVVAEGLSACLSGKHLAEWAPIKQNFNEIRGLVSAVDEVYKAFYLSTLYGVAEFCQAMPFSATCFNGRYGLLMRQLTLTVAALKLRRGALLPKNANSEAIAAEDAQWTYALFSVCLLKDIHAIQHDRKIMLHRANGDAVGCWTPFSGSLYEKAFYYRLEFIKQNPLENTDVLMATLAGRIVPPVAVRWLAHNKTLYSLWWASLLHTAQDNNVLEEMIKKAADKTGILLLKDAQLKNKKPEVPAEIEQWITWLLKNIKENSEAIFRIKNGLFIRDHLIDDFLTEIPHLSKDLFVQRLDKANRLILNNDTIYHSIAPKQFADRRILNGLVLNMDFLPPVLQAVPVNDQFKEHIVL